MAAIYIKRVYELAEKTDGLRVLVDRLWPRGLKKEEAQVDEWIKEIAPSVTLRKWFDHDPEKWQVFIKRYTSELEQNDVAENLMKLLRDNKTVTLLYASRDENHNHALVLQQFVNGMQK